MGRAHGGGSSGFSPGRRTPPPMRAAACGRQWRSPSAAAATRCWRADRPAPTKSPGAGADRTCRPGPARFPEQVALEGGGQLLQGHFHAFAQSVHGLFGLGQRGFQAVLTGTRLSANDSMPNLRALDTSSWARRRTFSASARTRSSWSCCSLTVAWAASSCAQLVQLGQQVVLGGGAASRRRRARASGLRARGVPSWGVLQKNGFRRHEWGPIPYFKPGIAKYSPAAEPLRKIGVALLFPVRLGGRGRIAGWKAVLQRPVDPGLIRFRLGMDGDGVAGGKGLGQRLVQLMLDLILVHRGNYRPLFTVLPVLGS